MPGRGIRRILRRDCAVADRARVRPWIPQFPVGTLVINLVRQLYPRLVLRLRRPCVWVCPDDLEIRHRRPALSGAYTTFSTFMYESDALMRQGAWLKASTNLVGSIVLGLLAIRLATWHRDSNRGGASPTWFIGEESVGRPTKHALSLLGEQVLLRIYLSSAVARRIRRPSSGIVKSARQRRTRRGDRAQGHHGLRHARHREGVADVDGRARAASSSKSSIQPQKIQQFLDRHARQDPDPWPGDARARQRHDVPPAKDRAGESLSPFRATKAAIDLAADPTRRPHDHQRERRAPARLHRRIRPARIQAAVRGDPRPKPASRAYRAQPFFAASKASAPTASSTRRRCLEMSTDLPIVIEIVDCREDRDAAAVPGAGR